MDRNNESRVEVETDFAKLFPKKQPVYLEKLEEVGNKTKKPFVNFL